MKKILSLILIIALCIPFVACKKTDGEQSAPVTYIGIEINPSVELTVDKNGVVCTVYGTNQDGAVLLFENEDQIVGKAYEDAIAYITTVAHGLGYLTEGAQIKTTVYTSTKESAEQIRERVHSTLQSTANDLGVHISTIHAVGREILRTLNSLKERYPENERVQALTPEQLKLTLTVCENDELTLIEALELTDGELIAKVNEVHTRVSHLATDLYRAAKANAMMAYDIAAGALVDSAYTSVYANRTATNPILMTNTFYYGATYAAYKNIARTLALLEEALEVSEQVQNFAIVAHIAYEIVDLLGIEDIALLEDAEHGITLKSMTRVAEKMLDNGDYSEEVEARVDALLDEAERLAKIYALTEGEYSDDLLALKLAIENAASTIQISSSPYLLLMNTQAKTMLNEAVQYLEDCAQTIEFIAHGGMSLADFEALADSAEERADEMLEIILSDLSDEEKEALAEKQQQLREDTDSLKEVLTDRLAVAEESAKEYLTRLREELQSAKGE